MPNWAEMGEGLKHAWNAFRGRDRPFDHGEGSYYRPDYRRRLGTNEKSIATAILNQIATDVAAVNLYHARLDQNGRFIGQIPSHLNECLTLSANIDQTGRGFIHDLTMSMFDEGCVAAVPVETTINPLTTSGYDITNLRAGRITQWYPQHVRIDLYNEQTGRHEEIELPKDKVAIIENPLRAVMNEPNSTLQRLIRKLVLLDAIDDQSSSGKLDLIIQLPYVIKTDARRKQAEERRKLIEDQLAGSKYGIAYTDGTERITQLNRAVENNLLTQIQYLTDMLYSQLGLAPEIFNGTADEKVMLNYYNRTIEPILSAIADEFKRKFLTKTARTQGQSIVFLRDPFKLVPVSSIADIADKFVTNQVLSPNEIRGIVGFKPVDDPQADELRNTHLNQSPDDPQPATTNEEAYAEEYPEDYLEEEQPM